MWGVRPRVKPAPELARAVPQLVETYGRAVEQEAPFSDVLGSCYMQIASHGQKQWLGQFFSPASVCDLKAAMALGPLRERGLTTICDPACGSGAMLLAACRRVLRVDGLPGLKRMSVNGIDLDPVCVDMAAAQLLANCNTHGVQLGEIRILHGDALGDPMRLRLVVHATPRTEPALVLRRLRHWRKLPMLYDVCLNGAMRLKVVNVPAESMADAAMKAQRFAQKNHRDAELCRQWPPRRDGRTRIAYAEVMDEWAADALVDRVGDEDYVESRWFRADPDGHGFVLAELQNPEFAFERRNVLVLSTAHLTRETRDAISAGHSYPILASFPYGWYVHVAADGGDTLQDAIRPDLAAAIEFARRLACDEIKFDCDGPVVEGLRAYPEAA